MMKHDSRLRQAHRFTVMIAFTFLFPSLGKTQVTIGYENNGADPYMISQSQELFKKTMKTRVKTVEFNSGPAAMGALASGSLQFMCGIGMPPVVSALSQGLPLVIIYNQERYTRDAGIVVRAGAGIQSVADLKGKKIAIVQGSQSTFELASFLTEASLPFDSADQINMSPAEMRAAWSTNRIDAAIVWDPVFDALQEMGGIALKTDADLPAGDSSYNICIADKNWAHAHPSETVGFIEALNEGVDFLIKNHDAAVTIMANAAGIDRKTAETELKGYQIYGSKKQASQAVLGSENNTSSSATVQTIKNTASILLKIGRLTKPLENPSLAVDPSYAIQAAK